MPSHANGTGQNLKYSPVYFYYHLTHSVGEFCHGQHLVQKVFFNEAEEGGGVMILKTALYNCSLPVTQNQPVSIRETNECGREFMSAFWVFRRTMFLMKPSCFFSHSPPISLSKYNCTKTYCGSNN